MKPQKIFQIFIFFIAGALISPSFLFANSFNQLIEQKQILKNQFGIATLECFPFTKEIGFTEHQIPLIEKCLQGVTTLKEALAQVDHTDYKEVGISNRFLKTAGFHTILIDWKASSSGLVRFLSQRLNLSLIHISEPTRPY